MSGLHYRQGQQASPAGSFPRTLLFSLLTVLLSLAIFVAIGVALMRSSPTAGQPSGPGENGQGEGHTPVVVCHWVPAHGGSFVIITVDDDGANGNNALQAHLGHPNDIIKPESLDPCVSPAPTPPEPTATPPPATPTDPTATPTDPGGGHTPVVVCHWVPAHGGSFVIITVDDDGADGNNSLQAHLGHPNDIINPESLSACGSPTSTPQPPTATPQPPTATPPEVTLTPQPPTATPPEVTPSPTSPPGVTPTATTPAATPTQEIEPTVIGPTATPEPTVADPTATPGATVKGPPQAGGGFSMPGGDGQLLIGIITLASLGMSLTGLGYWRRRLGQ